MKKTIIAALILLFTAATTIALIHEVRDNHEKR